MPAFVVIGHGSGRMQEHRPESAMNIASQHDSITFPHGFLDFLRVSQGRRHRIGSCELQPARLERFNQALRALSPDAPSLTLDQMATAAERALAHHADGATPPFVASRMTALQRLEGMAADDAWQPSEEARRVVVVLRGYRNDNDDLIPDEEPVIGLLDDAVLIDVALQLLRGELADYEDFCRFRRVAAEFAGLTEADTGLTRAHWLEAMLQAHNSLDRVHARPRERYVPDPRASLFHIT
jgi:uncharacterized membrane protein YkvA (DUF1232 family)